jgi:mono/diheme cytochrome c family protein
MRLKNRSSVYYLLLVLIILLTACGDATATSAPIPTTPPATTAPVATKATTTTAAASSTPTTTTAAVATKATTTVVGTASSTPTTTVAATTSAVTGDAAKGKTGFLSQGCAACHGQVAQGDYGPKIAGTKLTFPQVLAQVRNPRNPDPAKSMTPFDAATLPDAQVADIYAYLQTLK